MDTLSRSFKILKSELGSIYWTFTFLYTIVNLNIKDVQKLKDFCFKLKNFSPKVSEILSVSVVARKSVKK